MKIEQLKKEKLAIPIEDTWPTPIEEGKKPMKFSMGQLFAVFLAFFFLGSTLAAY
jgi:hypothetical protein